MTNEIAPLRRENVERATLTLERAFSNDPLFTWVVPDPGQRAEALRRLNRVPLVFGLAHGHVVQSHEGMAVAIWIPPGHAVTAGGMIRSGILSVPFHIGFRPFLKFMQANGC